MENDDFDPQAECPACGALVRYDEWMPSPNDEKITCPECGHASDIVEVWGG